MSKVFNIIVKGGNEPKNILDIPNITFNTPTEGGVASANVSSELNLYDLTDVDGIRTIFQGSQILFKLVEDETLGDQRVKTYLFLFYGGMIFLEIIVSFRNNSFEQAVSVAGQVSIPS